MATQVYIARCVRSGGWWGVEIADGRGVHVKGGYTQARCLDQVDVAEDSFDVRLEPQLPADVLQEVEEARAPCAGKLKTFSSLWPTQPAEQPRILSSGSI